MFTVCNFKIYSEIPFVAVLASLPLIVIVKTVLRNYQPRQRTTTVELLLNITSHMQCSLNFGVGNFFSFVVWSFLLFDTFKSFVSPDRNMQFIFTIHLL